MKKFLTYILSVLMLTGLCGVLSGCGKGKKISSLEELYAMESNKSYRLTCDIDLEGREWLPLSVEKFDGGGYTIKNAIIQGAFSEEYGGFFQRAEEVNNIIFENITVNISLSQGAYFGIVAGGITEGMQNVAVKNSTARFMSTNSEVFRTRFGGLAGRVDNNIQNCTIENSQIEGFSVSSLHTGGIVGDYNAGNGDEIQMAGCKATNVTITLDSDDYIYVGGAIGLLESGRTEGFTVDGATIKVNKDEEGKLYCGGVAGIVGEKASSDNCALRRSIAQNCILDVSAKDQIRVGGVAGGAHRRIEDCLSSNNQLSGTTMYKEEYCAYVAGLCGYAGMVVRNSISQGCVINGDASGKDIRFAGLIGYTESTIANCAVNNNIFKVANYDVFTKNCEQIHASYIVSDEEIANNTSKVPLLSSSDWLNGVSKLGLDSHWSIDGTMAKLTN